MENFGSTQLHTWNFLKFSLLPVLTVRSNSIILKELSPAFLSPASRNLMACPSAWTITLLKSLKKDTNRSILWWEMTWESFICTIFGNLIKVKVPQHLTGMPATGTCRAPRKSTRWITMFLHATSTRSNQKFMESWISRMKRSMIDKNFQITASTKSFVLLSALLTSELLKNKFITDGSQR